MHVGGATGDFSQAGCLERVLGFDDAREEFAAANIRACEPSVVKTVVGEIPAAVAANTLSPGVEQLEAAFGGFRNSALIAFDPGIEWRASRDHGAFKRGDGFRDVPGFERFNDPVRRLSRPAMVVHRHLLSSNRPARERW